MCGIGCVIVKDGNGIEYAKKILIGQKNRGSSSTGVAYITDHEMVIQKNTVSPDIFIKQLKDIKTNAVICHSRMPSVGDVTLQNAHPFAACNERFALVHNGTFSEHRLLKNLLTETHNIQGTTDSEMLMHFIEEYGELKGYDKMLSSFVGQRFILLFKDKIIGIGSFYIIKDKNGIYVFQDEEVSSHLFGGKEKQIYNFDGYFEIDLEKYALKLVGHYTTSWQYIRKLCNRKDTWFKDSIDEDFENDEDDEADAELNDNDFEKSKIKKWKRWL